MSERDGVIEAMARYGRACDTRDYALLESCFTEDAVVRYSRTFSEDLHGRAELARYLERALSGLDATQHLFGNFEVELDGESAVMRCYVHAQHVRESVPGGHLFTVGGRYRNELVRGTDERWRMTLLEFEVLWTGGNPEVLAHVTDRPR